MLPSEYPRLILPGAVVHVVVIELRALIRPLRKRGAEVPVGRSDQRTIVIFGAQGDARGMTFEDGEVDQVVGVDKRNRDVVLKLAGRLRGTSINGDLREFRARAARAAIVV